MTPPCFVFYAIAPNLQVDHYCWWETLPTRSWVCVSCHPALPSCYSVQTPMQHSPQPTPASSSETAPSPEDQKLFLVKKKIYTHNFVCKFNLILWFIVLLLHNVLHSQWWVGDLLIKCQHTVLISSSCIWDWTSSSIMVSIRLLLVSNCSSTLFLASDNIVLSSRNSCNNKFTNKSCICQIILELQNHF